MIYYLVKDNSKWMSDFVYLSESDAILRQSWRIEDPVCNVDEDFPITILKFDTKIRLIQECVKLSKDEFIQVVARIKSLKKGGAK